jgi:hypothetical protein
VMATGYDGYRYLITACELYATDYIGVAAQRIIRPGCRGSVRPLQWRRACS